MTKQPLIVSPADNADFKNFMINYISENNKYPDLTEVFTWLQNNFSIEDYIDVPLSHYGLDEVSDYIKNKRLEPEDVFSEDELNSWAVSNGFIEDDNND